MKSTVDLACNPKLKGRIPFAIKEALANAAALEELTIGLVGLQLRLHPSGLHLPCTSKQSNAQSAARDKQKLPNISKHFSV